MHSFYERSRSAHSSSVATYFPWALAAVQSWKIALKDWPRPRLTQRNLTWFRAGNSYSYIRYPLPFVRGSAARCSWRAAQTASGAAGRLPGPGREAEGSLKLLVSSLLSCAKFTSLTLGTDCQACHN